MEIKGKVRTTPVRIDILDIIVLLEYSDCASSTSRRRRPLPHKGEGAHCPLTERDPFVSRIRNYLKPERCKKLVFAHYNKRLDRKIKRVDYESEAFKWDGGEGEAENVYG